MVKQQGIAGLVKNTPSFVGDPNSWKNYKPKPITQEIKLPNSIGALGWANVGLSGLTSGFQNFNAINSDSVNNTIDNASNIEVSAVNENDLINQLNNQQMLDTDYTVEDMGWNWGEQLGNIGSAALSGLSTGNPYAALLSGGLAAVGSVVGGIKAITEVNKAEDRALAVNKATNYKYQKEAADLYKDQFKNMLVNTVAEGGNLNNMFNTGFIDINNGGTHEENPLGGVPMGVDNQGIPNLVEEGEVIYNDYVYSNRLKLPKFYIEKYKLGKDKLTFADVVKDIQKSMEESPNDPITKRGVESRMEELRQLHEEEKMKKETKRLKKEVNKFSPGGDLKTGVDWMKYSPIVTSASGLISNVLTPPDYEYANKIERNVKPITPIEFTPLTDRLKYNPLDWEYSANKLRAEAAANREAILNTASNAGAARAGLLSLDRNAQEALGDAYRQTYLTNREELAKVADFNRAVNQFNLQQAMAALAQNRQFEADYLNRVMEATKLGYSIRDAENSARAAAISSGIESMGTNMANLYKDAYSNAQLNWLIERDILPAGFTKIEKD